MLLTPHFELFLPIPLSTLYIGRCQFNYKASGNEKKKKKLIVRLMGCGNGRTKFKLTPKIYRVLH